MTTPTSCTCLDSPNMLAGLCQWCEERQKQQQQERTMSEALKGGVDYLTANKLAAISTALMSDTPVSMAAAILPDGHALDTAAYRDAIRAAKKIMELRNRVAELEARIPPSQAEPVAGDQIDANNPSSVPERFRQCMIDAAEYIAPRAMNTPGAGYTTKEGVLQMLTDLLALSLNDGCVAAAWAFEQIVQSVPKAEPVEAKEPWKPVVGEKVLVEAVVKNVYESGIYIWVMEDRGGARDAVVSTSQLRPLPGEREVAK